MKRDCSRDPHVVKRVTHHAHKVAKDTTRLELVTLDSSCGGDMHVALLAKGAELSNIGDRIVVANASFPGFNWSDIAWEYGRREEVV
jgi:exoribonuclease II